MRTCIVLLPGALESENEVPLFENGSVAVQRLFQRAELSRITSKKELAPEVEWLGLDPQDFDLSPGVLFVAAVGADPPSRSVHFHLSLLSTVDGEVWQPEFSPREDELEEILRLARKLETPKLRIVEGRGLDHGLVWEDGSIELRCATPDEAAAEGIRRALPEGDGELLLRRFIDDSVNLLTELNFNRMRREENLEALNLLWPWGQGLRPAMPNLALQRGGHVRIESSSFRLAGLSRLVGYRHDDPWAMGSGTNVKLGRMTETLRAEPLALAVIPEIGAFRSMNKEEEAAWLGREVSQHILEPLASEGSRDPRRVMLVATQRTGLGLALDFRSDGPTGDSSLPFSAEILEEKGIRSKTLHETIAEALSP